MSKCELSLKVLQIANFSQITHSPTLGELSLGEVSRREIIKRIPCVCACVRVLLSVCHAFIKGCTSHWLFLLGLFNVFYDLIAYVLSFENYSI